jgi:hypothetical protein
MEEVRGQTDLNGGERKALAGIGIIFVKVNPIVQHSGYGFSRLIWYMYMACSASRMSPVRGTFGYTCLLTWCAVRCSG